jgi:hypothetical protein
LRWQNCHAQYFGEPFLKPLENEVYVDAGAFDGDTIREFLSYCGENYKKIYGFEPDNNLFSKLKKYVGEASLHNTLVFQKGAWSRECVYDSMQLVPIDHIIDTATPVTFIKMDIEGAELEALKGAKNTIQRNRPTLAICVYHKAEDILTIPHFIKSLIPEYKLYLRNHGEFTFCSETVLYAVL